MIDGYDNYSISSFGRVKNTTTSRIIKQCINCGYYKVQLCKDKQKKTLPIHRLVAFAFCNNDNEYNVVDHIDRNPLNNHFLNVRWCTYSMNNRNRTINNDNTSGIKGVYFNAIHNCWVAQWNDNEQNRCNNSFSIKKYGDQAKQHAINKRLEMESLYGYI